jgi:hypothetical protein
VALRGVRAYPGRCVVSRSRDRGTAWESAVVRYLRASGWPYAERRALAGNQDRGDIAGVPGAVIECKHVARTDLSGWLDEAEAERDNDGARHGAVWLKRRGTTDPGRSYVLLSGDDYVRLLRDAHGLSDEAAS